jgi:hypothetical protein
MRSNPYLQKQKVSLPSWISLKTEKVARHQLSPLKSSAMTTVNTILLSIIYQTSYDFVLGLWKHRSKSQRPRDLTHLLCNAQQSDWLITKRPIMMRRLSSCAATGLMMKEYPGDPQQLGRFDYTRGFMDWSAVVPADIVYRAGMSIKGSICRVPRVSFSFKHAYLDIFC